MPRRRDGPSEPYEAGTGQQGLGREPTPCRHQFGPRQTVVPLAAAEADMPGLCVLYQEVVASGDQGRCAEARARAENEPRAGARDRRSYPYQVGWVVLFEDAEDPGERSLTSRTASSPSATPIPSRSNRQGALVSRVTPPATRPATARQVERGRGVLGSSR